MTIKSYKSDYSEWEEWNLDDESDDEIEIEIEVSQYTPKKTKYMKKTFINSKIKKLKFNEETVKDLKFGDINDFMFPDDGNEGYLSAYSEEVYFAYQFQKRHNFHPDVVILRKIKSNQFIEQLFKYCVIPDNAFYKSYSIERGEISINTFFIAFKGESENDQIYLFLDTNEAVIFYNPKYEGDENNTLNTIVRLLKGVEEPKITKNKIYVVYQNSNGFEKKGFEVKKINVDLEANYNDGFAKVSDEIIEGLNDKNKTNLVILKGAPGTGKTTYIRHLTSKLKKNIIFISPDMVNHITDPSFIPFLINNNDAVLIIEDAEPALGKRDLNGRTGAVSNILNLTDGLLSDCLNISIVATINTKDKDIDEALLRKGRLLKNYNFEKLSIEKSKNLLKKLGREDVDVKEPMTLAEIYYYDKDNNVNEYNKKKIGFGN